MLKAVYPYRFFAGAVFFVILFHFTAYLGHYGFDDILYARLAHDVLHGTVDWSDHFAFRWTTIGFTALSYLVLGVNDVASSIPALAAGIFILYIVHRIVAKEKVSV